MRYRNYRGEEPPRFAHPAEREVAELLDANGIAWQYEPRTFELDHHEDGRLRQAFTPDFYLPDADAYIECTTMRQSNTNRKNQKVRKLRLLHGEVVTVLYRRDLERLRSKYGRGL
jgi:hypothetical protein